MSEYPRREPFFAYRYCRLLAKTCAAMELGPDGCWMLSVIAMLEDTKRYTGPVLYYNEQLMAVIGFTRRHTLNAVRNRAIDSGWLHYEQGGKRKPGRYWVLIPPRYADLPDTFYDENVTQSQVSCDENVIEKQDCVTHSMTNSSPKADTKRPPFLHSPIPNDERARDRPDRKYATEFVTWYSAYPRKVAKGAAAKAYAKAAAIVGHQKLLEAVQAFAQSEVAHTEFCPYPATWLNTERYDDDPAEWSGHSKGPRVATKEDLAAWTA